MVLDVFGVSQHYAIIVLPHGGCDLEAQDFMQSSSLLVSYIAPKKAAKSSGGSFHGPWHQCASVFWQVCEALAVAERTVAFEVRFVRCFVIGPILTHRDIQHRDLHWGQILVENVAPPSIPPDYEGVNAAMNSPMHGVKATIIDFGLSRMEVQGYGEPSNHGNEMTTGVQYTKLEEAIFQGEGVTQ